MKDGKTGGCSCGAGKSRGKCGHCAEKEKKGKSRSCK